MIYRQGDISLQRVDPIVVPSEFKKGKSSQCVLALGEATGHVHTLEAASWLVDACEDLGQYAADGTARTERVQGGYPLLFVEIDEEAQLTHQEHDALTIAPGVYWVKRQREYAPERSRFVAD